MSDRPNVLFLMADQMQARVLDPRHPCMTPNFDRLAARGVRFANAYTSNAICSPARAGLMTGLLPHNHGVLTVTHLVDDDQCCLRTEHPHWAQRLTDAGYLTGYFGKWHIERSNDLRRFGWQVDCGSDGDRMRPRMHAAHQAAGQAELKHARYYQTPGYAKSVFYGATNVPPEQRGMGIVATEALRFLEEASANSQPWCCFVSVSEPHDPFVASERALARYDVDAIELPRNLNDDLSGRPGIYRKAARVWQDMSRREHREAAACYYASITEIDEQFGRLLDRLEQSDQRDNTIVVLTADHGELLGAHGLYCKNFSASEEVYNIPLIVAGPGIASGMVSAARVGSHDLCPTLLELTGCDPIDVPDSRSFAAVLTDSRRQEASYTRGYAEYHGGRYILTQRIAWDGPWKFVFNGFDFDELYNLEQDPWEMQNLIDEPAYRGRVEQMMSYVWQRIRDTNDHSLLNSHYPILRIAPVGPLVLEEQ